LHLFLILFCIANTSLTLSLSLVFVVLYETTIANYYNNNKRKKQLEFHNYTNNSYNKLNIN